MAKAQSTVMQSVAASVAQPVVGRFAPSPTGRMHLGNVYVALAAWLAVRKAGGRFLLRIEDIDGPRSVKDADRWIMDDLAWLGLDWDGEVVYQSQRLDLYEQALKTLQSEVFEGERTAYPCFCLRADLRAASAPNESDGFLVYPGTCRKYAAADSTAELSAPSASFDTVPDLSVRHSWRLAMPRPSSAANDVRFHDEIFGDQDWHLAQQVGDIVIRRSDGLFAYQLAVTVDDLLQGVNQVVRGRDLLRSTAAQIWLRKRLISGGFGGGTVRQNAAGAVLTADCAGATTYLHTAANPDYAHLPLLRSPENRRLAKRDHSIEIAALRESGVSPQRVIGYLAYLLGLVDDAHAQVEPRELIELFDWNCIVRSQWGTADRIVDPATLMQ